MFAFRLMGIVTTRDIEFIADRHTPVAEVMTTDLITAPAEAGAAQVSAARSARFGHVQVMQLAVSQRSLSS